MLTLEKYSFGVGDRFAHQAKAQLRAFQMLAKDGIHVTPVWNKSNREHTFIGSSPQSVFDSAQAAVNELGWTKGWHVDADHIRFDTVDGFINCSDFFTIDVADSIGKPAAATDIEIFVTRHPELVGRLHISGASTPFTSSRSDVERAAAKYLLAVQDAAKLYRQIASRKGADHFIAEVSMDETDTPQTPVELLLILAAMADERIAVQTIAPKFCGRFNKGVDYVGNLAQFEQEFCDDLAVIAFATQQYELPPNLKLSIHSGSDKFSLYPIIRRALPKFDAGVHVKTAGTTWLEELIGLAQAGGDGLAFVQEIYSDAIDHLDELCAPYATVIDIDSAQLPTATQVSHWSSEQFTDALRHNPRHPQFNSSLRQLLHVSFKLAAKKGKRYLELLETNEAVVSQNVIENLYSRHLRPLFTDQSKLAGGN